jgi:hypothetical protein
VLGALLVSLSTAFLYSSHLARDDIFAAAFGYAALSLYLCNRKEERPWPAFSSGLRLGLAFEIHPHSAIFAPALGILYFADLRAGFFRRRHFWYFAAGGLAGGLFYLERHILRYPATYSAISQLFFLATHTPPLLTGELGLIRQGFLETVMLLFQQYQVLAPVLLWAAGTVVVELLFATSPTAFVKRTLDRFSRTSQNPEKTGPPLDRSETIPNAGWTLLLVNFLLILGMTLLIRNKFRHYAILVTPAVDLLLAFYLLRFLRKPWQGRVQDYANRAAWVLLAIAVALNWSVVREDPLEPYQRVEARLRSSVRPGDRLLGPQTYWFGLYDHPFSDWLQLVIYQRSAPGSSLKDAFQALRPDVFIVDGSMEVFITDQAGNTPFLQHFQIPRRELEEFLASHARLVTTYDDPAWAPIRVYRLDWQGLEEPAASH